MRLNKYVDFTVIEITEGGAEVSHHRKEDNLPASFAKRGWTNNLAAIFQRWIEMSEPGDMFTFQSGWVFHRIPK